MERRRGELGCLALNGVVQGDALEVTVDGVGYAKSPYATVLEGAGRRPAPTVPVWALRAPRSTELRCTVRTFTVWAVVPDVLGPHHARAELTYGAVWMR